jgi:uncharacterized protein DUF4190
MGFPDQPSSQGPQQPPPPGGYGGYQPAPGQGGPAGYQGPGYQGPGYQAPGYQGYGYQGPGYATAKTNGMAIAALICGIAQFVAFGPLTGIPAIILGHLSRKQIRQTGEQGAGMATAGLVLGYIGLALDVIFVIILIGVVASVHTST